jgi:hypothetical protein
MKKVMLLVLTVMLVSAFLMASGPTLRVVTLTVINKSGNEVMIKLEGSDIGKQFYYLTIPAGNKNWPTTEVFTVLEDVYKRTTWYGEGDVAQCVGLSSSGWLVMDRNNRLVFTPCNYVPKRTIRTWDLQADGTYNWGFHAVTNAGEPSMEKVVYIKYEKVWYGTDLKAKAISGSNIAARRCGNLWVGWKTTSTKIPNLCMWRYIYGGLD